jgi:hypothetical protein
MILDISPPVYNAKPKILLEPSSPVTVLIAAPYSTIGSAEPALV